MKRHDGRAFDELREVRIQKDFVKNSDGSVLVEFGNTQVICTANFSSGVPGWMKAQDKEGGWLTAEYAMLPGATDSRNRRENQKGPSGRSSEIQRLIGRSLRSIVDLTKLGQHTVHLDCDVLNADGGTRCASITGAYVALGLAVQKLLAEGKLEENPILESIAAVSIGMIDGQVLLDLPYVEDSAADVDMNVVMTSDGKITEVQGTAEEKTFTRAELNAMLDLAEKGLSDIFAIQKEALS